jgi:hypothetical protein
MFQVSLMGRNDATGISFPAQFLFPLGAPPFLPLAIDALALASDVTLPILDANNATGTSHLQLGHSID